MGGLITAKAMSAAWPMLPTSHHAVTPPSTGKFTPLMKAASSETDMIPHLRGKHTATLSLSGDFRLEEGEPQVFAAGFSVELRLFADGGRSAAALAPDLEGVGSAEVEGVLAVFPGEGVDRLVELPDLLRPEGVLEEGVLDPRILDEVHQHDAGRPVDFVALVHPVEQAAEQIGELRREGRGAEAV